MLLFNNRSQQSIGKNSIISNRLGAGVGGHLISPIGERQFNFNSQLAGSALPVVGKKLDLNQDEDGDQQRSEVPKSASSKKNDEEESKESEYEDGGENYVNKDDGGFETESP